MVPVAISQTFTVVSSEPDTMPNPSTVKSTHFTGLYEKMLENMRGEGEEEEEGRKGGEEWGERGGREGKNGEKVEEGRGKMKGEREMYVIIYE